MANVESVNQRGPRVTSVTQIDPHISVQQAGSSASDGWAVLIRQDEQPPVIMNVYISRDLAEGEAERLRQQVIHNI